MQTIQMHLSEKQKSFSDVFCSFFKSTLNFEHFQKKVTLIGYVFRNLQPPKIWLDKCLKSSVWDDPSTRNMVNGPKHLFNLITSSFALFVDHFEDKGVGKSHS